jgi:UDP-N-acetylmuramoyl-tripeptide--D-alanyl-D-alanine ligase
MDVNTLYTLFLDAKNVTTDSRNIEKNSIFFALKGATFNGNVFAEEALSKGASYAVIDEKKYKTHERILLVDDVLHTLQQLAHHHREKLKLPILGLTGSNGKTTTKELLYAVLSKKFKTVATVGNFNNHIGVPLTLLAMNSATEFGIVEMGANHQKEITALCAIAAPDYGYITNFGKAHLEGFGSVAGVIKGKSELYDYLIQYHKFIFYNADDVVQVDKLKNYNKKYGFSTHSNKGNIQLQLIASNPFAEIEVEKKTISSQLIGRYNFTNIAIAITVGRYFNIPFNDIKEAIADYAPVHNRSQYLEKNSNTIILDAYNANPTSMLAALENFSAFSGNHKIAFLGDMFELGDKAPKEHQAIASYAEKLKIEQIYLVGKNFYDTKTSLPKYNTFEALAEILKHQSFKHKTILIKGSRGMAMERILSYL